MGRLLNSRMKSLGAETKMDVLRKTAQIISGQFDIEVIFKGSQAYTDMESLIVVPSLPEDAPDDLVEAIIGFVDHEVGHCRHTDTECFKSHLDEIKKEPRLKVLTNCAEDVRQERLMTREFRGAGLNMEAKDEWTLSRLDKTLAGLSEEDVPLFNRFCVLSIAYAKAHSPECRNPQMYQDFYDKHVGDLQPIVEHPEILEEIMSWEGLPTTEDAWESSKRILELLKEQNEDAANDADTSQPDQPKGDPCEDGEPGEDGNSSDDNSGENDEGDDDGESSGSGKKGGEDDDSEPSDGESSDGESSDGEQSDDEQSDDGSDAAGDRSDNESGEDASSGSDDGDDENGDDPGAGESQSDADEDGDDESAGGSSGDDEGDGDDEQDGSGSDGDDDEGDAGPSLAVNERHDARCHGLPHDCIISTFPNDIMRPCDGNPDVYAVSHVSLCFTIINLRGTVSIDPESK